MVEEEKEIVEEVTKTLYEKTNEATQRLEEANKKKEELLEREEELYMKNQLGGKSDAGQEIPKVEETPEEYSKRILKGESNERA